MASNDHLLRALDRFAGASVLVVGDVMLDQFVVGRVSRISPEAPVPVVVYERDEHRVGGAANVANNVRALGGRVELVGLTGADAAGQRLRDLLAALGMGTSGLVRDPARRTTTKLRVVTDRNQQVARIDYETDEEANGAVEQALAIQAEHLVQRADVVVVSDYLKGAVTRTLMARVVAAGKARSIPVLVDPKIPHLDYYAGASLVTPNHQEAEVATHLRIRHDEDAVRASTVFRERARCERVLITRGEHGMCLLDGDLPRHFKELTYARYAPRALLTAAGRALAGRRSAQTAAFVRELVAALHEDGVLEARIEPFRVADLELDVVVPSLCGCGAGTATRGWTEKGVKCCEVHLEVACPACGVAHRLRFCRPRLAG